MTMHWIIYWVALFSFFLNLLYPLSGVVLLVTMFATIIVVAVGCVLMLPNNAYIESEKYRLSESAFIERRKTLENKRRRGFFYIALTAIVACCIILLIQFQLSENKIKLHRETIGAAVTTGYTPIDTGQTSALKSVGVID